MEPAVEELTEVILPILRDHGVVRAGIFGSRSRAEHGPDSDLDLLVEFEEGRSLLDLVGLELDLTERVGIETQVVTYRSLHPLLRDRILSEEIRILPRKIRESSSNTSLSVQISLLSTSEMWNGKISQKTS